jgi:hypothetical protein
MEELDLKLKNRFKMPLDSFLGIREKLMEAFRWKRTKSFYDVIGGKSRQTHDFVAALSVAMNIPSTKILDTRYNFYEVIEGEFVALTPYEMRYINAAKREDDTSIYEAAIQAAKKNGCVSIIQFKEIFHYQPIDGSQPTNSGELMWHRLWDNFQGDILLFEKDLCETDKLKWDGYWAKQMVLPTVYYPAILYHTVQETPLP